MRRTMFGKSPELERLAPPRASISEALLFDVSDQQASADLTLAERRVESWSFAPWQLLAGHLIIAALQGFFADGGVALLGGSE